MTSSPDHQRNSARYRRKISPIFNTSVENYKIEKDTQKYQFKTCSGQKTEAMRNPRVKNSTYVGLLSVPSVKSNGNIAACAGEESKRVKFGISSLCFGAVFCQVWSKSYGSYWL